MNEENKALTTVLLIAVVAISGLVVLFNESVTGAISGQQTAYSRIYGLRYTRNPCSILDCEWGESTGIFMGYDPVTGHAICRCPEHKEPFFQVSHWRKQG